MISSHDEKTKDNCSEKVSLGKQVGSAEKKIFGLCRHKRYMNST